MGNQMDKELFGKLLVSLEEIRNKLDGKDREMFDDLTEPYELEKERHKTSNFILEEMKKNEMA